MASPSRVGVALGTMTFGIKKGAQTKKADAVTMIKKFVSSPLSGASPELDSARMYQNGDTEVLLGQILAEDPSLDHVKISSKANAFATHDKSLRPESVRRQWEATHAALGASRPLGIFYLHAPDVKCPIEETLAAVQALYEAGGFTELGLSNYAAWEVMFIANYMRGRGWVEPTVYQGMYNAITRGVESELLPCLRRLGMRCYVYNPLAGGMLTGKYTSRDQGTGVKTGRFNCKSVWGRAYQGRFMTEGHFDAISKLATACEEAGISMTAASLRWLVHHSQLRGANGDKVILGASTLGHFDGNMAALAEGPLGEPTLLAIEAANMAAAPLAPGYSRSYSAAELEAA